VAVHRKGQLQKREDMQTKYKRYDKERGEDGGGSTSEGIASAASRRWAGGEGIGAKRIFVDLGSLEQKREVKGRAIKNEKEAGMGRRKVGTRI